MIADPEDPFGEPSVKLADTSAPVHDLIRKRWSPRSFADRPVSDTDLRSLLEAARWAASSSNEQPWIFFVARKSEPAEFEKLFNLLVPGNQAWAGKAPVLMMMAARNTMARNGAPNQYALHDAGQAFAQLCLQAVALGLHVHGMAGFDRGRAVIDLNIPEEYSLGAAMAVGYAGPPEQLPEKYREMELSKRQRKPLEQFVFGAGWETASPIG
jgi:nitroreductase